MLKNMFILGSAILSAFIAQLLKPIIYYLFIEHTWKPCLIKDSGGFPSSHSSMVTTLSILVGLTEGFSSTLFAITCAFSIIIIYDAANVRYYSGQNAKITKQLIKDLKEDNPLEFGNPIYNIKLKDVLGHKWQEVLGGIILGAIIAIALYNIMY